MPPHTSNKLEDQAASAALGSSNETSTKPTKGLLGPDGKLSSASAAVSLKHAQAQDLPAFPTVGLLNAGASAGTAASLAEQKKTSFEHWKPGDIPAANKAALLAKDYKMDPLWQPNLSAAGSRAALLASKDGGNVDVWVPHKTPHGHSAAEQAMRKTPSKSSSHHDAASDKNKRALTAATGAMKSRTRSGSMPDQTSSYPDAANSAANALKAATSANRSNGATDAKSKPQPNPSVTTMSRDLFTSNPLVGPELDEQNRQAGLRAAAVSMAQKMYELQQKALDQTASAPNSSSHRAAGAASERPQSASSSIDSSTPAYVNLQEAATRLAAQRLAKLHDEHAAYRAYYGTQPSIGSKKMSIRGRNRAMSDVPNSVTDEGRSRQIRNEMSIFSDSIAQVDAQRQQKDRESLMAAAQRNVRASMTAQDEQVFRATGNPSASMKADWEAKAKLKAQADSDARLLNHGMVDVGGGKYLDQAEIEAIAAARLQPTLDEISAVAEQNRARDAELRQQELEREQIDREKAADDRERAAKAKEEWKKFKDEEKREEKNRKAEAKSKKHLEKQLREEEKRKSKMPTIAVIMSSADSAPAPNQTSNGGATNDKQMGSANPQTERQDDIDHDDIGKSEATVPQHAAGPVEEQAADTESETRHGIRDSTADVSGMPSSGGSGAQISSEHQNAAESQAPLAARIAPTVQSSSPKPPATTITHIEAKPLQKDKDNHRVSTWLKTKLQRPNKSAPEEPKLRAVVAEPPESTSTSNEPPSGELEPVNRIRPTPAPKISDANLHHEAHELPGAENENKNATGGAHEQDDPTLLSASHARSPSVSSISSLSSDEDNRGRSTLRLADTYQQKAQDVDDPRSGVTDPLHAHPVARAPLNDSATSTRGLESETPNNDAPSEANKASTGPLLASKSVSEHEARNSESPARDSKFMEAL